jgi:hypothetical protein
MSRRDRKKLSMGDIYKLRQDGNKKISTWFMSFPQNTKFYKAGVGEHNLVIIPYEIKTDNHPLVRKRKRNIGEGDYLLDVEVHQEVGPENKQVICLEKNYGVECPICEEGRASNKENENPYKTSRRVVYNVVDADKPEEGVQIFSVSHYLFEKELLDEVKALSKGEEYIQFANIENGNIISFRGRKEYAKTPKGTSVEYTGYRSFKFLDRDKEIEDMYEKERWEEKSLSLDEFMVVYDYEEIKNILYGYEENDDELVKETKEEVKEEKTERESRRSRRRETRKETKNNECPSGYTFGKDWEMNKECDDCDVGDECEAEYKANWEEKDK